MKKNFRAAAEVEHLKETVFEMMKKDSKLDLDPQRMVIDIKPYGYLAYCLAKGVDLNNPKLNTPNGYFYFNKNGRAVRSEIKFIDYKPQKSSVTYMDIMSQWLNYSLGLFGLSIQKNPALTSVKAMADVDPPLCYDCVNVDTRTGVEWPGEINVCKLESGVCCYHMPGSPNYHYASCPLG